MEEKKLSAYAAIDSVSKQICDLSDAIWDTPETAFLETEATRLQCELLEKLGFHGNGDFGGDRRRSGADIGGKIAERKIGFMPDGAYDGNR